MLVITALYSITVWCVTDRMLLDRQERSFFRDAIRREWRLLSQVVVRAEAA
jgi:hypothetical protein